MKLPGTRFPTLQKERTTPILTEQKVVGRQTETVHNNYNSIVALYPDVRISSDVKAGGTKRHFSKWAELTSDPWILEQITGVTPDLFISPKQYVLPREITWSQSELELINEELAKMIKTGVIRKVNNVDRDQYISNIFFRYKSNKNLRVILNLKRFNKFVNSVHFKMEGLKDALYLIYEGCFSQQ